MAAPDRAVCPGPRLPYGTAHRAVNHRSFLSKPKLLSTFSRACTKSPAAEILQRLSEMTEDEGRVIVLAREEGEVQCLSTERSPV
ncbi:hypothetical protein J6590_008829 [Homalodisca vitripennis]|nr:hypothetical protein J6590_008829 [Homalodisca vitripennis]